MKGYDYYYFFSLFIDVAIMEDFTQLNIITQKESWVYSFCQILSQLIITYVGALYTWVQSVEMDLLYALGVD